MEIIQQTKDFMLLIFLSVVVTFVTQKIKDFVSLKKEDIFVTVVNFFVAGFLVYAYDVGVIATFVKYMNFEVPEGIRVIQQVGDIFVSACVISGGSNSVFDFVKAVTTAWQAKSGYAEIKQQELIENEVKDEPRLLG